ncbi:hypothetical protein FIV42_27210 [Persicimonas caeni]|uniref:Uncharacterized protein n=1 Tax=Persicimonas caeni TaxID=2292766 RepID=A0A4Y6Q149_PERCE|nr:hypothetical protein [Persicimonas caeni]QDG54301.1 hypothetical protein FIV42_27210 [Persicimonas caeni]QED35522.1 hypothetical protein FRD00_27205 [Persicimonas caeni]
MAVCLGVLASAQPAVAQQAEFDEEELFEKPEAEEEASSREQAGQRQVRRLEEKPLQQMSVDDARAAGFVFGDPAEESSRTSATFLAATAGLLAHGVGHFYLDETNTAGMLLAAEGASIVLMASAVLWPWLSDGSTASKMYARPALYAGVGLFGLSYLLDVVGTMQSADIGLPANTRQTRGFSIEATYRHLSLEGFGDQTLQLLTAGSTADLGWGYVGARTDQDVYLDTSVYGLTLGGRPWRGPGRHTFAFVEVDGEWLSFGGIGRFRRLGGQARVGVSFGLGNWISQLRHVAVGTAIGYGHHWYRFPTAQGTDMSFATSAGYVPFEMFMHLNLTERLNAKAAYEHREGDFLQTNPAGLAVASVEFLYQSTDLLQLVVRGEVGGGLGLVGGLRVSFGN